MSEPITKADLAEFATKKDLQAYPTKIDLKEALENYPTKTDLQEALEPYATKDELKTELKNGFDGLEDRLTKRIEFAQAELAGMTQRALQETKKMFNLSMHN